MKQMFEISEKLIVGQSNEIYGVNTVNWADSSWKYLSLVDDELHTSLRIFRFCILLGKDEREPTIK